MSDEEKELSDFRERYGLWIIRDEFRKIMENEIKQYAPEIFEYRALRTSEDSVVWEFCELHNVKCSVWPMSASGLVRELLKLKRLYGHGKSEKIDNYLALIERTERFYDICRRRL